MTSWQIALSIGVMAAVTVLTRALPFWIFPEGKPIPPYIRKLGRTLPPAVIGLLVIYCFKSVSLAAWPFGLPELLAGLFVVGVHLWKHNLLLSIGGGTVLYMVLVQLVF